MTPEEAARIAQDNLQDFACSGTPQKLSGGLLNYVFRALGSPAPVIVKRAPPYVASAPHIPLSSARARFEADALGYLQSARSGELKVRTPKLLGFDRKTSTILMEDLGPSRSLGEYLRGAKDARGLGEQLGRFLAWLHRSTFGSGELAATFNNLDVQKTRQAVQYRAARSFAERARLSKAAQIGALAEDLGARLLKPGRCLIMGDLWPASILILEDGALGLVDWEFCHFGSPAQDVGHLDAHLWMLEHRGGAEPGFKEAFRAAYLHDLGALWDEVLAREAAVHGGCEILTRSVGAFSDGFLYDGLSYDHPAIVEACTEAQVRICGEKE